VVSTKKKDKQIRNYDLVYLCFLATFKCNCT